MLAPGRRQLVGLVTEDRALVLQEDAQVVAGPDQLVPMTMLGHVTSICRSEALGRSIALAVLADGRARDGQRLHAAMPGGAIPVRVLRPTAL